MALNKHTPGPWHRVESGEATYVIGRPTWPCARNGVQQEWEVATVDDLNGDHLDEVKANARLIAAAPEMLSELKRDLQFAREMKGLIEALKGKKWVQHTMVLSRIEMLTAAIAKAEGRS